MLPKRWDGSDINFHLSPWVDGIVTAPWADSDTPITLPTEHTLNAWFSASIPLTTGGPTLFAQGVVYWRTRERRLSNITFYLLVNILVEQFSLLWWINPPTGRCVAFHQSRCSDLHEPNLQRPVSVSSPPRNVPRRFRPFSKLFWHYRLHQMIWTFNKLVCSLLLLQSCAPSCTLHWSVPFSPWLIYMAPLSCSSIFMLCIHTHIPTIFCFRPLQFTKATLMSRAFLSFPQYLPDLSKLRDFCTIPSTRLLTLFLHSFSLRELVGSVQASQETSTWCLIT